MFNLIIGVGMVSLIPIIILIIIILTLISGMFVFIKAGEAGWKSLIPVYNSYVQAKFTTNTGLLGLLLYVPIIQIPFWVYLQYSLAKSFGKGIGFTILSLLFPFVTNIMLGFGDAQYLGTINDLADKNIDLQNLNLSKEERSQIKKRNRNQDIVLNLNNKYKDYESEAVFKFYEKFKDDEEKQLKEVRAKRKAANKKNREKIFSIKALTTEINGYGFNYSLKQYSLTLAIVIVALLVAGFFYSLKVPFLLAILLLAIILMPGMISTQFRYIYEQQKFSDVVDYMEYMLYEFKKKPKILYALKAAEDSCTGDIKKRIKKAIDYIENGVYRNDLYKEAFYFIEEGYNCERITVLHQFLIKIEREGGEYQEALNILLDDIKSWTERTYELQKEKANIKMKVLITIFLSLVMCGVLTKVSLKVQDITGNNLYQAVTTGLVFAFAILYAVVQKKLSGSWLVSDAIPRKKMFQQYAIAISNDTATLRKKEIPNMIIFALIGCLFFFGGDTFPILANFKNLGIIAWIYSAYTVILKPKQDINNAKKKTMKEITKEFPGWFRNLAINLQKETVHVSIKNSLKDAPLVLKPALISLIKELDDDPVTMKPYINFLSSFELPDISSAMKMLYSLNEAGQDEIVNQVNTLVERNNKLLEKSERLKNADSIAMAGYVVALPMAFCIVKMIVDMGLILIGFMASVA